MSYFIPELRRELCINCNEIKIVKTEITLEFSEFPQSKRNLQQGCLCEDCYYCNIREYRIALVYPTK